MKKKLVAGVILGVVVVSLILAAVVKPGRGPAGRSGTGKNEVGVIYIDGVIASGRKSVGLLDAMTGSEDIAGALREASRNPELKAVVIRLNSPGGTPAAAQEISAEIERLKQSGKKVVASMGDTAASGAYWIAAGADRIVANPGTLTGSIGVIMQYYNLQDLYDKVGVGAETFKSGPYKDMGSPDRPATPEESAIFQSMIDDIFNQFIEVVAEGRHMDKTEVRKLADGRVYTGRQAMELGLVDRLGDFHDAVLLAAELAGVPGEPGIVEIGPRNFWEEVFSEVRGRSPWGFGLPVVPCQWGGACVPELR
ncbi:MAG TPA: signal peptide peptidase SppA [Bacillota bacterium]|nr:signal peptide peptidase SppA [Bacillota bacterium]